MYDVHKFERFTLVTFRAAVEYLQTNNFLNGDDEMFQVTPIKQPQGN